MANRDDKKPLFSSAMMHFLQNRLMEIVGISLFLVSGLLLISLITAGKTDPSFSQISNEPVSNWLGPFGADISAALYSTIGIAAFFLAFVPFFWSLSYFRKEAVPFLRCLLLLQALSSECYGLKHLLYLLCD